MSVLVSPEVLARIEKATRSYKKWMAEAENKIVTNIQAEAKLKDAAIPFTFCEWADRLYLRSEKPEQKTNFLKSVHKVLGRLKETGERKIIDTRRHIIQIELTPVNYPGVTIKYYHKLDKNGKCKIVRARTQKQRVETVHKLVCSKD